MTVVIIKLSKAVQKHLALHGYINTCKELKTDIVNIGHVVILASVTVVDLCTKYAVLMKKNCVVSSATEQPTFCQLDQTHNLLNLGQYGSKINIYVLNMSHGISLN